MFAMLEPSPRYSPGAVAAGRLQLETALETAVDLSRKSTNIGVKAEVEADPEDSEDEAPLDLKVRPSSSASIESKSYDQLGITEAKPGFPKDAEMADFPTETACTLCGADAQSPTFDATKHGENLCGVGTISCSACTKTFSLWSHYETHKKTHQKIKSRQYPCQTCGKIFTSASNRNMHQRIHKGVRPFRCIPCGVFFRQKAHLQKHQKTQGHLQATEIFEKKNRNESAESSGLREEENSIKSEDSEFATGTSPSTVFAESTQFMTTSPTVVVNYSLQSPSPTTSLQSASSRSKSSPKRKQLNPQQAVHHPTEESDEELDVVTEDDNNKADDTSDDTIRASIDFNDTTHGYDCCQCSFSSHDLAHIKEHVREDHISSTGHDEGLRCSECKIWFMTEYHLEIHNRKHDEDLSCNLCEVRQEFKVPNKLIKHMEEIHSVCPSCGNPQEDQASLLKHLEQVHGENKGFHSSLLQFSSLNRLTSPSHVKVSTHISHENRAAKMRKVDSLAETIRQKKQLKCNLTNAVNGNESKMAPIPALSPPSCTSTPHHRKRKGEPAFQYQPEAHSKQLLQLHPDLPQHPLGISTLVNQLSAKVEASSRDMLHKGENNNVLMHGHSSLKDLSQQGVRLPTQPVSGLTPPSSPSPNHQQQPARIHGEVSVTIVSGQHHSDDSDDAEETGLDLSMGKNRRNSHGDEDYEASASAPPAEQRKSLASLAAAADLYSKLPIGQPGAPAFPGAFAFPFGAMVPPPPSGADPILAEQLLKLAQGLPRPGVPHAVAPHPPPFQIQPFQLPKATPPQIAIATAPMPGQSLSAATTAAGLPPGPAYNVLTAMLGHVPTFQPAFPGLLPVSAAPTTVVTVSPAPPPEEDPSSNDNKPSDPTKPFRCTYCRKEFAHLNSLESHMDQIHKGDSKHNCEECGRSFSSKSNLTAHKKIHSGERPFECQVCHKRFRQKAHLQKHETTHSSATPYQCTVCDKAFGHISNLNTHMATHSNVRPYQCTECGKSYKDSASFKRHKQTHETDAATTSEQPAKGEEDEIDDEMEEDNNNDDNEAEESDKKLAASSKSNFNNNLNEKKSIRKA